jgi:hypothetical protein
MASKSAADFLAEMVRINVAVSIHTQQLHHTRSLCAALTLVQLMACVWATRDAHQAILSGVPTEMRLPPKRRGVLTRGKLYSHRVRRSIHNLNCQKRVIFFVLHERCEQRRWWWWWCMACSCALCENSCYVAQAHATLELSVSPSLDNLNLTFCHSPAMGCSPSARTVRARHM